MCITKITKLLTILAPLGITIGSAGGGAFLLCQQRMKTTISENGR